MSDFSSSGAKALSLIVAVVIGGGFYVYGKQMDRVSSVQSPLIISVSADAKVSAPPDIATMTFGMNTGRQPTAKAATEALAKTMAKVIDATKKAGVEEKDIATESFYLSPEYDYTTSGQIPRGFQATQTLRVKVRDLDKVGDILTAATAAGANQAGGVSFGIDNPDAVKAQAREMAIAEAKEKAKVLADNLGMSLGRMTGFSEGGDYTSPVPMMAKDSYGVGGGAIEIQRLELPAGEQEIVSNVTLTYELR